MVISSISFNLNICGEFEREIDQGIYGGHTRASIGYTMQLASYNEIGNAFVRVTDAENLLFREKHP